MGRAPDQDRTGRDHGARGYQGALAEDASAAEPGARHEDRAVADLAHVADISTDDRGPVTEDGALAYADRMPGSADHHPVLQDGRVVANAYRGVMRAHDQALRQDRPGTDDHRGTGDLWPGLVNQHLVEAHGGLTVLPAIAASSRPVPTLRSLITPSA